MVFALVLLVLLGISFLYNVGHALGGGLSHGKVFMRSLWAEIG